MNKCILNKSITKKFLIGFCFLILSSYLNVVSASINTDAERIFNWAENQFDFFPSHQATLSFDSWRYRFYPGSGIHVGVNLNDRGVYVLGGAFGSQPLYVDSVQNILQSVLPYELEQQRFNDVLTRILQAEFVDDIRPETGHWANSERPDTGLEIHFSGSDLFLIWYTFDENGLPIWYFAKSPFHGSKTWSAELLLASYDAVDKSLQVTAAGLVNLTFIHAKQAIFEWTVSNSNGSEVIERIVTDATRLALSFTGLYLDPNDPTWGISTDLQGSVLAVNVYGYDHQGKSRWFSGIKTDADIENSNVLALNLFSFSNGSGPNVDYKVPTGNPGGQIIINLDAIALSRSDSSDNSFSIDPKQNITAMSVNAVNFADQSPFKKVTQKADKFTLPKFDPIINGPVKVAPGSEGHHYSVSFLSDPLLDLIPPSFLWQGIRHVRHLSSPDNDNTLVAFTTPDNLPSTGILSVQLFLPANNIPYEAFKLVNLTSI